MRRQEGETFPLRPSALEQDCMYGLALHQSCGKCRQKSAATREGEPTLTVRLLRLLKVSKLCKNSR